MTIRFSSAAFLHSAGGLTSKHADADMIHLSNQYKLSGTTCLHDADVKSHKCRGWIEMPLLLFISDLIIMAALYISFVLSLISSGTGSLSFLGSDVSALLSSVSLDRLNASLIMLCKEIELEYTSSGLEWSGGLMKDNFFTKAITKSLLQVLSRIPI